MKKDYSAQLLHQKEKMSTVKGTYNNDFVNEFKEACKYLNLVQSKVIRKAMEEIIEEARLKKSENGETAMKTRQLLNTTELINEDLLSRLKESINLQISRCEKLTDDEWTADAIIRYNAYLKLVDERIKDAVNNNFKWYVIKGDVYITDGVNMANWITQSTFINKIMCPRLGKKVYVVNIQPRTITPKKNQEPLQDSK